MVLNYDFDGDFEFEITDEQLKEAIIDSVIRETCCTEEDAETFYRIAQNFDTGLTEIFDEDIHEYFEDEAREEDERKTKEDRAEIEQWNNDYYKSIK